MKKYLIIGFGREGIATAEYLRKAEPDAAITIADKSTTLPQAATDAIESLGLSTQTGETYLANHSDFDIVIKSAGVPLKSIKSYIPNTVTLTSPTNLFLDACPGTIIGVTGTKGKSTTTSLIYEILKAGNKKAIICGNIGVPAVAHLNEIDKDTLVVMELSSHQLQLTTKSPHIAILQNIVPEHLDFYEDFDDYVSAKANITKYQNADDYFLYNAAYEIPTKIAQTTAAIKIPFNKMSDDGCYVDGDSIVYAAHGNTETVIAEKETQLPGKHNLQNMMPAIIVGKMYGVDTTTIASAIKHFKGLDDRLALVGTVNGVNYYNDSLATEPHATIAAIDAFDDRVQTLIAGGFDRGIPYDVLAKPILDSGIETLILFRPSGERIWQEIEEELRSKNQESRVTHYFVESMTEAVKIAKEHTTPGHVVLLSPASPSFGTFKDYHDRGEQFKAAVLRNE